MLLFITALANAQHAFSEKTTQGNSPPKTLFELGWKVEELNTLVSDCRQLVVEAKTLVDKFEDASVDHVISNTALQLSKLRKNLTTFVRGISRQRRTPATHIFILMISCEQRNCKPYAIPIQCIPYHTIDEKRMRRLISNVLEKMKDRGMKIAGQYSCVMYTHSILILLVLVLEYVTQMRQHEHVLVPCRVH